MRRPRCADLHHESILDAIEIQHRDRMLIRVSDLRDVLVAQVAPSLARREGPLASRHRVAEHGVQVVGKKLHPPRGRAARRGEKD